MRYSVLAPCFKGRSEAFEALRCSKLRSKLRAREGSFETDSLGLRLFAHVTDNLSRSCCFCCYGQFRNYGIPFDDDPIYYHNAHTTRPPYR